MTTSTRRAKEELPPPETVFGTPSHCAPDSRDHSPTPRWLTRSDDAGWCEQASEAAGLGVWEWDLRSGQERWSALCQALVGLPRGVQMSFERFLGAVHAEDRERARAAVDACLSGRTATYQVDCRVARPGNTEVRWLRLIGQVQRAEDGSPLHLCGALRDVTERILLEDALVESDVRFRALVEVMPQLVWSARPDGSAHYHNSRFYEYTGAAPDTLQGNGWTQGCSTLRGGDCESRAPQVRIGMAGLLALGIPEPADV